jgi:hypothetical protein
VASLFYRGARGVLFGCRCRRPSCELAAMMELEEALVPFDSGLGGAVQWSSV